MQCRFKHFTVKFNARQPKVDKTRVWHRKAALIYPNRKHINAESSVRNLSLPPLQANAMHAVNFPALPYNNHDIYINIIMLHPALVSASCLAMTLTSTA